MTSILQIFLFLAIIWANVHSETLIRNRYVFLADLGQLAQFAHNCYEKADQRTGKMSMEALIGLVEHLETRLANSSDSARKALSSPEKLARIILQRFNFENVNPATMEQDALTLNQAQIDSKIMGLLPDVANEYAFPDDLLTQEEQCRLMAMFSHYFKYANGTIQEEGVLQLHQNSSEAVSPAKLFAGIIAGLTEQVSLSGKAISSKLGAAMSHEVSLQDAVLAVTIGNAMGTASFFEFQKANYDPKLIFGTTGHWNDSGIYLLDDVTHLEALRKSSRATLAQLRGALDGALIGAQLRKIKINLSLSSILAAYYQRPEIANWVGKLGVSYCDRFEQKPAWAEVNAAGSSYSALYNFIYSQEGAAYQGNLMHDAMDRALNTEKDFCATALWPKKTYKLRCTVDEL